MRRILYLMIWLPIILYAQDENVLPKRSVSTGIKFEQGLKWDEVQKKAKKENKYIFVDCYTTWCTPCKQMEKDVYPMKNVGDYFNSKFISIKVQMDKTEKDNEQIKIWYEDAFRIQLQFQVDVFPTFLFLSPDGKPVHRAAGGYPVEQFIKLGKDAFDPARQYYTTLAEYQKGEMDTSEMKVLALSFLTFGGKELAEKIAIDYLSRLNHNQLYTVNNLKFIQRFSECSKIQEIANNYISILNKTNLNTKEIIEFLRAFTRSSKDKGFDIFYKNSRKINKIMGDKRYVQMIVDNIIYREEINPIILAVGHSDAAELDWEKIRNIITNKYTPFYANRNIINAKVSWYDLKQNNSEYFKNLVLSIDKYKVNNNSFGLNNIAWEIFKTSYDSIELNKALFWAYRAIKLAPGWSYCIDTYANLLYKLKRTDEAIKWELKALQIANEKRSEADIQLFKETLTKMKRGQSTWIVE